VLPVLRKFKDLQVPTGGKDIPDASMIETTTRLISSPELQPDFIDNVTTLERKT
jgi:hypothetical protein